MHAGNFVAIRDRSKPPGSVKIFESMPIYARYAFPLYPELIVKSTSKARRRIGMHLLFYGKEQVKLLEAHKIEGILKEQTLKVSSTTSSLDSYSYFQ